MSTEQYLIELKLFQQVKSFKIRVISNGSATPIVTTSNTGSSTSVLKKRAKTRKEKGSEKKSSREKVQTRATTAKAKQNKNVRFITEENKNQIWWSLFVSSIEDISSQNTETKLATQLSSDAIASTSTHDHQAANMTPPNQNVQRVSPTGNNYRYSLRRSTILNSSNRVTVSTKMLIIKK